MSLDDPTDTEADLLEFFDELDQSLRCSVSTVDRMVCELVDVRERRGRVFCLGVGGGAANAAHAVCDLRKLCEVEAYAPTDSVAELTARANDEGWDTIFVEWLRRSRLGPKDAILVFSVGGGTPSISACIHGAVHFASERGAVVMGVVGSNGGAVALNGDPVVVVWPSDDRLRTPVTEAAQAAVLHALVSDPRLQVRKTKW